MHIKNDLIPSGAIGSTLNAYIFNYPACEWHLEWKLDCICLFLLQSISWEREPSPVDETLTCLFFQLTDSDTVLILNIIHVTTIVDADKKMKLHSWNF